MLNITPKHAAYLTLALTIVFFAPEIFAINTHLETQLEQVNKLFVQQIGKTGLLVGAVVAIVYSIFTGKIQQAFVVFGVLLASSFILNWVQEPEFFTFFAKK